MDTDVVIILVGKFHQLLTINPSASIWVTFGSGKAFTYFHINSICHSLGENKSLALPAFHSFTGCDTTSGFFGKGKKLAWEEVLHPRVCKSRSGCGARCGYTKAY